MSLQTCPEELTSWHPNPHTRQLKTKQKKTKNEKKTKNKFEISARSLSPAQCTRQTRKFQRKSNGQPQVRKGTKPYKLLIDFPDDPTNLYMQPTSTLSFFSFFPLSTHTRPGGTCMEPIDRILQKTLVTSFDQQVFRKTYRAGRAFN
jgi:hypothetical protein